MPHRVRQKAIGERLRKIRTARGLSQKMVAEAAAVSRAAVSAWEHGKSSATIDNLEQAANRLNCSVEWLRTGVGEPPSLTTEAGARPPVRFEDVAFFSKQVDQPPFSGAVAEVEGGIGAGVPHKGALQTVHEWWRLPPELLHETLRVRPDTVRAFALRNDAWEPEIKRGSHVFVDLNQTTLLHNGIFAIDNGVSILLKRVILDPSHARTVGLKDGRNGHGETLLIPVKKLKVVGRVICYMVYS